MAEAEIGHLKEALEKKEVEKAKAEADMALEKKRRRVAEVKVAEVEKKAEGKIAEVGHLAIEAFKASPEFTKIKVKFGRETFEVG